MFRIVFIIKVVLQGTMKEEGKKYVSADFVKFLQVCRSSIKEEINKILVICYTRNI